MLTDIPTMITFRLVCSLEGEPPGITKTWSNEWSKKWSISGQMVITERRMGDDVIQSPESDGFSSAAAAANQPRTEDQWHAGYSDQYVSVRAVPVPVRAVRISASASRAPGGLLSGTQALAAIPVTLGSHALRAVQPSARASCPPPSESLEGTRVRLPRVGESLVGALRHSSPPLALIGPCPTDPRGTHLVPFPCGTLVLDKQSQPPDTFQFSLNVSEI